MISLNQYIKESLLEPEADIVDKKFCYKVGSYYNDGKIEGIVASVKDNGDPHLIMSLDQPKEEMTWIESMKYNKTLKDRWHIPSKEELEEVWHKDREITNILNKSLKKYNSTELNRWYWSSSEYNENNAWLMYTSNGCVYGDRKDFTYSVRPFITF